MMIEFTGNEANAAEMLGILTALWSLLHFIVAPIVGELSDCFWAAAHFNIFGIYNGAQPFYLRHCPKKNAPTVIYFTIGAKATRNIISSQLITESALILTVK